MIGLEYVLVVYNKVFSDLAKELGITRQNVSIWLKGKRNIPKKYISQLSELFGVPEEYFQKELTDIDKLEIEKYKFRHDLINLNINTEDKLKMLKEFVIEIEDNIKTGVDK